MTLTDLHALFSQDAQRGLMLVMRCPLGCRKHGVGVPVTVGKDEPGRWNITSQDLDTLTATPSILNSWPKETPAEDRCPYHFNIVKGQILNCPS